MDLEFEPHPKLERCDGIFCELSPEDKVRWIASTEEGREAIEKEHCIKNGLNWGTRFEEDGVLLVPPPPFGATRILSENNPVYSEPAPLTAPLITDWSSRLKREHFGEDWVLGPDGKWQTKTKTAKIEPLGTGWVRRPDGKWE
jgi:hypothetical protein